MWASTWNSNVYTQINGSTGHVVGQELCYSGSCSGLVCGNIVTDPTFNYNLGGDLTNVTGFVTEHVSGTPAVGNGDSGGPGYSLVNTSGGLKRLAVGIISAIPGDSGTACSGVPGALDGRRCSPVVISTSVNQIGANTGWFVPTT